MASAINGLKVVDAVGNRRTRPLLLGVILAIAIAHRLGRHVVARLYLRGNQPAKLILRGHARVFGFVADKINTPLSAAVIWPRWRFTGCWSRRDARQHLLW